ncbi:biliverdin-producing heme oxygenase [Cellulomonas sp. JZ18]|uniref:biliverdin-producing heme oxygenase n=1 Tax=Cellulomonas sp. JZ18 TaxID=2654191 RepID=UPI0012D3D819|nr:biliverdin-producing heme oxygenase [Cellulomonas sp. JZ18]QGQ19833.1 biliverdin-producing heme oxygenase [Cellulomonas sp. JZ18]
MTVADAARVPCDPDLPLSVRLRTGTRADHEAAERSAFVEHLLSGALTRDAYVDLAVQQHAVYTALEEVGDALLATTPDASAVVLEDLRRLPSIEDDLAFLLGADWPARARVLPATARYAAHLREHATTLPRWVAHAYTRYLGDLSGGQVVHRMMQRHYGLGEQGLSFYRFAAAPRVTPFKDEYRDRLDALPLTEEQRREVVDEARRAFALNRGVFADLGAVHHP